MFDIDPIINLLDKERTKKRRQNYLTYNERNDKLIFSRSLIKKGISFSIF
jgi:hypothetical protein